MSLLPQSESVPAPLGALASKLNLPPIFLIIRPSTSRWKPTNSRAGATAKDFRAESFDISVSGVSDHESVIYFDGPHHRYKRPGPKQVACCRMVADPTEISLFSLSEKCLPAWTMREERDIVRPFFTISATQAGCTGQRRAGALEAHSCTDT